MLNSEKVGELRTVITESLRVQLGGSKIEYINVGTALSDAKSKQNHTIFARRGCGKTLLLHHSSSLLPEDLRAVYLNCEDFKQHSFPNVLIEILASVFREMASNLKPWFGRKKELKTTIDKIIERLDKLRAEADETTLDVQQNTESTSKSSSELTVALKYGSLSSAFSEEESGGRALSTQQSFQEHKSKLRQLDHWLPELKRTVREFFKMSSKVKCIFLQIDDLYHLKRLDQAFVVDYIHRLCKDVPLYFKIATLRHVSTLYADRDGQPIGAQERHDYQPIDIDYTFGDFPKTERQNWQILSRFGEKAGLSKEELEGLFKGEGFSRLIMAGGGVPRDVLSLFLDILSETDFENGQKIGKDEVRIKSRSNFERRIEELKQDSKDDEQDALLRGIYMIREFCLSRQSNIFNVEEKLLQTNDTLRALFYRLLDYRIIHNCASALTHKSHEGTYQSFAVDIGCYAHLRKLLSKFKEIDVAKKDAKESMRSAPILDFKRLQELSGKVPAEIEVALLSDDNED